MNDVPSPPFALLAPVVAVDVALLASSPVLVARSLRPEEFMLLLALWGFAVFVLSALRPVEEALAPPVMTVAPPWAIPPVPLDEVASSVCKGATVIATSLLSAPPVLPVAVTE